MKHWFFISPQELGKSSIVLKGEILQHFKALRLQEKDKVVLSDGRGRACLALIDKLAPEGARVSVLKEIEEAGGPPLDIILFLGILKGDKMELVVRSSVELGVKTIVPVFTDRTVVQMEEGKKQKRMLRWQKIARSAAAQCRRSYLPQVAVPVNMEEITSFIEDREVVFVPWEEEKGRSLYQALEGQGRVFPRRAAVFTGPEGGFSKREIEMLTAIPAVCTVSLGRRIMRAETAPLFVLSILMFLWGDAGGVRPDGSTLQNSRIPVKGEE